MRRRARIDLGQDASAKEEAVLSRKRQRWVARNKDKPEEENPFLKAIRPYEAHYGDPGEETAEELRNRLNNLEFGNFPGYFNYRNKAAGKGEESEGRTFELPQPLEAGLSDERLAFLEKEWFEGKNVLDIGCNRGHITYAIARLFAPKSIVGIDIDLKMIKMANRDFHLHLEDGLLPKANEFRHKRAAQLRSKDGSTDYVEHPNQFPISNYVLHGPVAVSNSLEPSRANDKKEDVQQYMFPNNILFVEHNYVLANDELVERQEAHFDTIVCLSVTKWIHLNYRDDGLKRFFKRIHRHLKPGGLLILEAQPFDNYGRRKRLSDRLRANYYSIKSFKPDQFDAYLLSEQVGFRRIIKASVTEHQCAGFKRPLKVFLK